MRSIIVQVARKHAARVCYFKSHAGVGIGTFVVLRIAGIEVPGGRVGEAAAPEEGREEQGDTPALAGARHS